MKTRIVFCLGLALAGYLLCLRLVLAGSNSADMDRVVAGNSEFALDLYGSLRSGEGNVFFSPYSISTALAMTYAGARAETADQMSGTLHFDLPSNKLHPVFSTLQTHLDAIQEKGQVQLAVANSLWPQAGFDFRPDYLALCAQYFGAAIVPLDFAHHTEAARKEINGWVSVRTARKIPELIRPKMLDESNRLVLVDAIYFKGNWRSKFPIGQTEDQLFHVSSEKAVTVPLMQQTAEFGYAEFPGLQALEMPYAGGDISMVVLLPRDVDGLGKIEAQLTPANLKTWTAGLANQKVQVFFPTFTVTSEFSLANTLSAMGMPDAFDVRNADFSGMDGRKDLYISRVIHQAYVKVDEEGTEAAGATAVMVTLGAAYDTHEPPIPVFRADHPFLLLIRDNQTGSILFLGRVMDPTR
ncbi:MAG TPA: serpin family protein [Candidatus Acidoferrales bacterium]|jgi:serine protease inhibitor|nr:serpin family protein [Candidatus Acidoferrales bacterium]